MSPIRNWCSSDSGQPIAHCRMGWRRRNVTWTGTRMRLQTGGMTSTSAIRSLATSATGSSRIGAGIPKGRRGLLGSSMSSKRPDVLARVLLPHHDAAEAFALGADGTDRRQVAQRAGRQEPGPDAGVDLGNLQGLVERRAPDLL